MPARRRANILSRITKVGKDDQGNERRKKKCDIEPKQCRQSTGEFSPGREEEPKK